MQNLLLWLQEGSVYVIACVILLGVLIFIHELGHFLVARWCGVRVETFSLGFGRKIWKKVKGDTTYCVSIIPLGGYVKMYGDQPGADVPESEKSVSFTHKTVGQRIAIVLAGPLMNLFFAVVVFAAVAMIGMETRAPVLGDIEAGTAAYEAGLRSGDRVTAVDGAEVATFEDVTNAMDAAIGRTMKFTVSRADGATAEVQAPVVSRPNPNPLSLKETIGDVDGLSSLSRAPLIGVPHGSPLWTAGLRSGDRVLSINGRKISAYREIQPALAATGTEPLTIAVERNEDGADERMEVTLAAEAARDAQALRIESSELYLDRVIEKSPAAAAGLVRGDRLVSLNGTGIARWEDVLETIRSYKGEGGIELVYNRDGQNKTVTLEPQMTSQMTAFGSEDRRYTIGITPKVEAAMPETVVQRTLNPLTAVVVGARQSWDFSVITVLSFVRLFQNKISHKTVGGLLSIGQAAGETMKLGVSKFLTMMAIISINLFVLNLLPVPVLDGGHLVFYTIEAVKGSPLSLKKMEIAQQVGLVLLMGLMVFALFNDVTRLIFGRL